MKKITLFFSAFLMCCATFAQEPVALVSVYPADGATNVLRQVIRLFITRLSWKNKNKKINPHRRYLDCEMSFVSKFVLQ
jgi:hypothetical protein